MTISHISLFKLVLILGLFAGLVLDQQANAQSPLENIRLPFQKKRVDADERQSYELTESNGPWMVMAASFVGEEGKVQARDLVLEIRQELNLPAFMFERDFDFTGEVAGRDWQLDKDDPERVIRKKMVHLQGDNFQETAVMVGDFASLEDPRAQKVLQAIKTAHPQSIQTGPNATNYQRLGALREFQRRVTGQEKVKGPMGNAFLSPNPMLPEEYFTRQGPDEFILKLNEKVEYSLLDCPGKYSVRVATFRGDTVFDPKEIEEKKKGFSLKNPLAKKEESKLALAADKAHRLTEALRKRKIEAYEFHDRAESYVCVGSFQSVGTPRRDGRVEINPDVHKVIEYYKAEQQSLPGLSGFASPKSLPELPKVPFDLQPIPVEAPRPSVLTNASRSR